VVHKFVVILLISTISSHLFSEHYEHTLYQNFQNPPLAREAAIVYVNGKRAGSLWHPPYRLDITAFAHPGENSLEVRVDNTASTNSLVNHPETIWR
jgi:hypothetical protein